MSEKTLRIIMVSFLSLLVLASCLRDPELAFVSDKTEARQWTVIVYMAADNDLEGAALRDINEMENSFRNDSNVTLLVLLDRSPIYDASNGNWNDTRVFEIVNDPSGDNAVIVSKRISCTDLGLDAETQTELDTANHLVLRHLGNFARRVYPAKEYALIIWGHGNGWRGGASSGISAATSFDDSSVSSMPLSRLSQAIENQNYAILGFDTCFGITLEAAYEFSGMNALMIGSPGASPADGWDYRRLLELFYATAGTPTDFCRAALTQYREQYRAVPGVSFACFRTAEAIALFSAWENFCGSISGTINNDVTRSLVREWIAGDVRQYQYYSYPCDLFIDLSSLASVVRSRVTELTDSIESRNELLTRSDALDDALNSAIPLGWDQMQDTSGTGQAQPCAVLYLPLEGPGIPAPRHNPAYIRGVESPDKARFIQDSRWWVPSEPTSESLLDRLFYTVF